MWEAKQQLVPLSSRTKLKLRRVNYKSELQIKSGPDCKHDKGVSSEQEKKRASDGHELH